MNTIETIRTLTGAPGPSGFEVAAAEEAEKLLSPLVDRVWRDRLGNVIGVRACGRGKRRKAVVGCPLR